MSAGRSGENGKLKFAFVSACYSQRAGQAFADAGVPHVCCVDLEEQLLDSAALRSNAALRPGCAALLDACRTVNDFGGASRVNELLDRIGLLARVLKNF